MKGQSEEKKVIAEFVEPGKNMSSVDLENLKEQQKRAEDQARIDAIKRKNRDKLSDLLGDDLLIREWTHPCLFHAEYNRQTSVSKFYPKSNVAVDEFYHFDEWEMKLTKFKKKALNDVGIKYVVLTPDVDLADAIAEIESQGTKEA